MVSARVEITKTGFYIKYKLNGIRQPFSLHKTAHYINAQQVRPYNRYQKSPQKYSQLNRSRGRTGFICLTRLGRKCTISGRTNATSYLYARRGTASGFIITAPESLLISGGNEIGESQASTR